MKKNLSISIFIMVFLATIIIHSCTKEKERAQSQTQNPTIQESGVPQNLLEAAKTWHAGQTAIHLFTSINSLNASNSNILMPDWSSAKLQRLKNGRLLMIVSGPVAKVDADSHYGVIRKFIFGTDGQNINGGSIVEVYGDLDYIQKHSTDLIENYNDKIANDFTGTVIFYDVNYKYI